MPSQMDVAKLADVSFMTVSRVINNKKNVSPETRERVLQAIETLGYRPNAAARALNSNKTKNIGVIFPGGEELVMAPYCIEFCLDVERRLKKNGYHLLLGSARSDGKIEDLTSLFFERKVDGLILFAPKDSDKEIEKLAKKDLPFVILHGRFKKGGLTYIDANNRKGMSLIIDYVYNLGHRRIGFVTGPLGSINAEDRLKYYKNELKERSIAFNEGLVFQGDWSLQSGCDGFNELMKISPRPSAIVFSNDQMAIGAIKAARDSGLCIPDDVSITGYDDTQYAPYCVPALTTVRQNIQNVGTLAAELILDSVEGRSVKRKIILEPELVLRDSCRRIR